MPKQLKDILAGVKSSKIVPGSTGSDPGVDYAPKAPNEQKFVKKHAREKHEDRVGNGDDVYQATNVKHSQASEPAHGHKSPKDKAVYEAKETTLKHYKGWGEHGPTGADRAEVPHVIQAKDAETAKRKAISHLKKNNASWNRIGDRNVYVREVTPKSVSEATKCNMTEEGTACPVHEMADCSKSKKTLKEIAKNPYAIGMAAAMKKTGDKPPLKKSTIVKGHEIAKAVQKEETELLDEVNHREYGSQGKMHPDMARGAKIGQHVDFYQHGTGDKAYGEVTKNDGKAVHIKVKGKTHKFAVASRLSEDLEINEDAKHRISVTVSDPNHTMASKRKETMQKFVKVSHEDPKQAVELGKKHFAKKGYKVHAAELASNVSEDLAVPLLGGDEDESAEMAKTQLRALANKALHLAMQLNDDQMVEPWVQSKIAVAKDYVTAVHDYMVYGDHDKGTEKEQTAPYDGGIDMTGAPRNTFPSFAADVNTGRNV